MKKYSQFLKELPSKTVVFAFGRFNPPTTGHELLVKAVKKLAASNKADHAIYASKSQDAKKNPLTVDKKVHYLNLMFPGTHFVAANEQERTFIEAVKNLNKKYKNLIMVAGSDRVPEYEKILTKYNGKDFHYDTIQVISAGERDPDADDASGMSASKMRAVAAKGDYSQFKKGLPSTMREIDGRRLMNDVRQGMGLEMVKEQINLVKDVLREQYFRGEIFNIGDIVESAGVQYEIVKRGSNHLLLKEQSGSLVSKWIQDVSIVEDVSTGYAPEEITFNGYTTKNLHHSADAAKAFQDTIARHGETKPAAVMHALMATDTYMGLSDLHLNQGKQPTETEKEQWIKAHDHAAQHLEELGDFLHHRDYWDNHKHEMEDMLSNYKEEGQAEMNEELTDKTLKTNDKIKVARIIATMLGIENAETTANPEQLINSALRKVRSKNLNPEALNILTKMLQLATEVGIKYDNSLVPSKLKESEEINKSSTYNAAKDRLRLKDYVKLKKMNKGNTETAVDQTAQKQQQVAGAVNPNSVVGHSITAPHEDDSDRRQKIQYVNERTELDESHVEFRLDHREKVKGDHKSTFADHEAKVSDTTDKATYVKVPSHKADSFKKAMKSKHGVTAELAEATTPYWKKASWIKKMSQAAKQERLARERKEKEAQAAKSVKEEVEINEDLHATIAKHLDKHISDFKSGHTGMDQFGSKVLDAHKKVAKEHGIEHKDAAKHVNHYVDSKLSEEVDLEEAVDMATLRQKLNKHTDLALKANREGNDEAVKKHQEHIGKIKDKMAKLVRSEEVDMSEYESDYTNNVDGEEMTDEELDQMVNDVDDIEDIIDAYDDEELAIVDDETGEEIPDTPEETIAEQSLMEVMSRIERMRAKMRIKRSQAKRERATKIALRTYSGTQKINKRARRLAIKLMKKRLLRGRDAASLSIGEKERIERVIERRKKIVGRLAMRLAPRVRQIEKARLSHKKFTKPEPAVAM